VTGRVHARAIGLAGLLLALLAAPSVRAQDEATITAHTGRQVVQVGFQAPDGFDTDELLYLIDQDVGRPYSPQRVGRSVELLFRLGQFDDVQARVREVEGGVELTVVLVPSPRIRRIELHGLTRPIGPAVRGVLSKGRGDPYVASDEVRLAREVEGFYRERGYLDVEVVPKVTRARFGGKVVKLEIDEGPPYRVSGIKVLPPEIAGYEAVRIERMLAPRLRVGKVYREADLEKAVEGLLEKYRRNGFVEVRLLSARSGQRGRRLPVGVEVDGDTHTVEISLPVEAGRLVEARFTVDGRELRSDTIDQGRRERVIGLDVAQRVSEAYAEDAGRQFERWLRRRGYYHADVRAVVADIAHERPALVPEEEQAQVDEVRVLQFDVVRGPRVGLRRSDFSSQGNVTATTLDLLRVLQEASPVVIGHRPAVATFLGVPIYRRFYTEGEMEEAAGVLRDWYRARGFLDISLDWQAQVPLRRDGAPGRRVELRITLDEGVRTQVERLDVALHVPVSDKTVKDWKARVEGRPFNPAEFEELAREARAELAELGFIDARVHADREFSDDRTLVRLRLTAEKGPNVRFGQVLVRESRHTHVGLIRREVADKPFELLRPGDTYRPSRLSLAQRRLLRTGLFDGVVLRPAQPTGRVRDVEIRVNERKRFSFVGGVGVTWPDDGPRVSGEVRGRNLDGRGLSVFVRGRASLDWRFLLGIQPQIDYRASLGVELPIPPGVPLRATIAGVVNEELDEPTYRVRRSSAGVSLGWRGSEDFSIDVRAEVQWRVSLRVDEVARLSALGDLPTLRPKLSDYQTLPMLGASVTVDKRDDPFNPRQGLYASVSVDTTPGEVDVTAPAFGRASSRVVGLIPIPGDVGLQLEASGGVAWSYNDELPPVEWRYRMGGTGTIRGYPLESIGPSGTRPGVLEEVGLLTGELPERSVPVGGNAFYRYSIELQVPIVFLDSWRFAVFHDGGNALLYGAVPDGIDPARADLAWSVGIGLRRITPIGPLRFDVAVRPTNLAKIPGIHSGEVVQVHFAVGAL
jgi:outer membrane protein assembly factor BamA